MDLIVYHIKLATIAVIINGMKKLKSVNGLVLLYNRKRICFIDVKPKVKNII